MRKIHFYLFCSFNYTTTINVIQLQHNSWLLQIISVTKLIKIFVEQVAMHSYSVAHLDAMLWA